MNFSLEQLAAFVSVYEARSFSKAALNIGKHRTTVGQVIANLEDQVAVTLFERSPRAVEPTKDGHLLYHYAKQTISQAHTFDRVALSLSFGELESITLAYPSFVPHLAITIIREQLIENYPSLRVNLLVRSQKEIREGLDDESIHFGIVNVRNANAISNIDYATIGNLHFRPYASKASSLTKLPENEVFSALQSSRQFVLKSLIDEGEGSAIVLSANYEVIDQLTVIVKLVQRGHGWTLLPHNIENISVLSESLVALNCQQIKGGFSLPIALWSLQSKPIIDVRRSVANGISRYLALHGS